MSKTRLGLVAGATIALAIVALGQSASTDEISVLSHSQNCTELKANWTSYLTGRSEIAPQDVLHEYSLKSKELACS